MTKQLMGALLLTSSLFTLPSFASPVLDMEFEYNVADDSPQRNHGRLWGNTPPTFEPSAVSAMGRSIAFNGSIGSYVFIADDNSLDFGTGDFSIAFAIKTSDEDSTTKTIIDKDTNAKAGFKVNWEGSLKKGAYGFTVEIHNGSKVGRFVPASKKTGANYYSAIVNDNKWHHVAITVDRDNYQGVAFYLDGVKMPYIMYDTLNTRITNLKQSLSNSRPLILGTTFGTQNNNFKGNLDSLKMYKKVLTSTEVKRLSSKLIAPTPIPTPYPTRIPPEPICPSSVDACPGK